MSDPGTSYRTRDEVQEMRKTRDPITGFRDRIVAAELAEMSEIKAIELGVKQHVDEAVKKAKVGHSDLIYIVLIINFCRATGRSARRSCTMISTRTTLAARCGAFSPETSTSTRKHRLRSTQTRSWSHTTIIIRVFATRLQRNACYSISPKESPRIRIRKK
jgi:hypothetical protein